MKREPIQELEERCLAQIEASRATAKCCRCNTGEQGSEFVATEQCALDEFISAIKHSYDDRMDNYDYCYIQMAVNNVIGRVLGTHFLGMQLIGDTEPTVHIRTSNGLFVFQSVSQLVKFEVAESRLRGYQREGISPIAKQHWLGIVELMYLFADRINLGEGEGTINFSTIPERLAEFANERATKNWTEVFDNDVVYTGHGRHILFRLSSFRSWLKSEHGFDIDHKKVAEMLLRASKPEHCKVSRVYINNRFVYVWTAYAPALRSRVRKGGVNLRRVLRRIGVRDTR